MPPTNARHLLARPRIRCSDFALPDTNNWCFETSMKPRMPAIRLAPLLGAMSLLGACTLVGGGGDGLEAGHATTKDLPNPGAPGQADALGGAAAASIPGRQLRRLSKREYDN